MRDAARGRATSRRFPNPDAVLPFVTPRIDRVAPRRHDDAWLAAHLDAPASRWLLLADLRIATDAAGTPITVSGPVAAPLLARGGDWAYLGDVDGASWFALDVTAHGLADRAPEDELAGHAASPLDDVRWTELRPLALSVDQELGALLAQARGLLAWHARHPRCAVCGAATHLDEAGYVRRCGDAACGAQHLSLIHI